MSHDQRHVHRRVERVQRTRVIAHAPDAVVSAAEPLVGREQGSPTTPSENHELGIVGTQPALHRSRQNLRRLDRSYPVTQDSFSIFTDIQGIRFLHVAPSEEAYHHVSEFAEQNGRRSPFRVGPEAVGSSSPRARARQEIHHDIGVDDDPHRRRRPP